MTSALVNGTTPPVIGRSQQNQHSTHQASPPIQTSARSKSKESQHERSASPSDDDSDKNVDCDESSTSDISIGHTSTYLHILKSKSAPFGPPPKNNRLGIEYKQNKKDKSLTLKGAKHERTMQMYVKNIEVECGEKPSEIEKKVTTYIEKGGVKILKVQIVKSHFVATIVGCKIIILEKNKKGFWKVTNSGQIILNVEYREGI